MQQDVIRFQAPQLPPLSEIERFFGASERARWFSNGGPCVTRLERECADYLGLIHPGVAVNNATSGLMVALRACLGQPSRDKPLVAVPSFTFIATVNAILWAGFQPLFLDVDPQDWHQSDDALEKLWEHRQALAGVVLCSTFGTAPRPARRERLAATVMELGVPAVVDSAAGFGSCDEAGRRLGDQGSAEIFSFHATKPFAVGEGGLVTSQSSEVLESIARLTNFGFNHERAVPGDVGINAKMSELTAATGLAVLRRYDDVLERRRSASRWLLDEVRDNGVAGQVGSEAGTFQFVAVTMPSSDARRRLLRNAHDAMVEVRTYFDPPMHALRPFTDFGTVGELAVTQSLAERVVALPMANDISAGALERIRDLVRNAV